MKLFLPKLIAGVTVLFFSTSIAFAQYTNPVTYAGISTVQDFMLALVDLVFLIAVPIIVICIIYSGFVFVTAGDNESKIAKARTIFLWTLVGALVLLGAKAIALAIQNTINTL